MNIKTKFNIGDIFWVVRKEYAFSGKCCKECGEQLRSKVEYNVWMSKVSVIKIVADEEDTRIQYENEDLNDYTEDRMYVTQKEAQQIADKYANDANEHNLIQYI